MSKRHYFWGKEKPSQFDPGYHKPRSRMYLEGNQVFIGGEMYDHEDNRLYENSGSFSASDYRQALQELVKRGESRIVNSENGCSLSFKETNGTIEISLSGNTYPSSTPGGASLSSTAVFHASLDQLQLPS